MHPHQDFPGKQSHGQQCNRHHLRWFGKSLPKCYRIRSHPEAKESKKKNWKFKKKDFKKYFNNGNWEYRRCVTSNIFRIVIPRTALKGIQKGIRRIHKELHTIAVFSSMETQRVHLVANTASSVNCVEICAPDHVWCNGVISLACSMGQVLLKEAEATINVGPRLVYVYATVNCRIFMYSGLFPILVW